jgi:hypothetical protein
MIRDMGSIPVTAFYFAEVHAPLPRENWGMKGIHDEDDSRCY